MLADVRDRWGTDALADEIMRDGCPSLMSSEEDRRWFATSLRVGASPAVAYALNRAFEETDLRDMLPAVRVPTLVLHRAPRAGERTGGRVPDPVRASGAGQR